MSCQTPVPVELKTKKGFTLVEVLMVLVIISIMAGLLITVIDPVKQRGRARDGTIIATANKIVAAVQAYNSAIGVYPTCAVLANSGATSEIQNVSTVSGDTNGCTAALGGSFVINSLVAPVLCADATGYTLGTPPSLVKCKFRYGSALVSGISQACLGIKMNLDTDIDNDGTPRPWLIWSSTSGALKDEATPSCAL